jgi:L-seryl-tRNA(Ser) seleniumtransferase
MEPENKQQNLLRRLPGIDRISEAITSDPCFADIPKSVVIDASRGVVENLRETILAGGGVTEESLYLPAVLEKVKTRAILAMELNLRRLVNATGIIVHTNLGRSLLTDEAAENVRTAATRYSNLEYDLSEGRRGSRYSAVEGILCEISGAQAAMIVNNNAAAVLLCLDTIARDRKVIVSRGELVEIGGSFRIPDVMTKSGCILKEVGATNRTHMKDYERAIEHDTGLLLKVHTSNYSIVGFTASLSLEELVTLGEKYKLPVMEDLGSGTFIDFSKYGLVKEPTVQESVAAGVDVVTFSGDKLLGGPQAGIIVGKKEILDQIKKNPLTRALRIDKMTLASLESTMRLYRDEKKAVERIPTLRMMFRAGGDIAAQAETLSGMLHDVGGTRIETECIVRSSKAGGGSLPLLDLPSTCVALRISGVSANAIEKNLRENAPPVIGRIEEDRFIMDLRCVQEEELAIIQSAFSRLIEKAGL